MFVHGNLSFAWDAGDTAGRRFAAVSLMRIKAATQVQVAAAFDTSPLTVWRWAQALSAGGGQRTGPAPQGATAGLQTHPRGDRHRRGAARAGPVAAGDRRAGRGLGGQRPPSTVRHRHRHQTDRDRYRDRSHNGFRRRHRHETGAGTQPEPGGPARTGGRAGAGIGVGGVVPVLADPVDRSAERALAAFGLIPHAPPVFTPCGRAPLAGLLLALPALAATGLADTAHSVYRELPNELELAGHDAVRGRVPRPAGHCQVHWWAW